MNKERRKRLNEIAVRTDAIIEKLASVSEDLQQIQAEEQDYYDMMPEPFQNGIKGLNAQAAIDALQDAIDNLDTMSSELDEFLQNIDAASM